MIIIIHIAIPTLYYGSSGLWSVALNDEIIV